MCQELDTNDTLTIVSKSHDKMSFVGARTESDYKWD